MNIFHPPCDCYPPDRTVLTRNEVTDVTCGRCGKLMVCTGLSVENEVDEIGARVKFSVASEATAMS